jgi:hypothetical protein
MLQIERFEYVRFGERLAIVLLRAGLGAQPAPPARAALQVTFGRYSTSSPARSCELEPAARVSF